MIFPQTDIYRLLVIGQKLMQGMDYNRETLAFWIRAYFDHVTVRGAKETPQGTIGGAKEIPEGTTSSGAEDASLPNEAGVWRIS